MTTTKKFFKHLKTIIKHRRSVRRVCFLLHIYWRGIKHDLSKFSLTEIKLYKFFSGTHSPHEQLRKKYGYSPVFNHHYHKNDHHWEYWIDFSEETGQPVPIKMPYNAVLEMFADFIGAGQTYEKNWTTRSPLRYYETKCRNKRIMHPQSEKLLVLLLTTLTKYQSVKKFSRDFYLRVRPILIKRYANNNIPASL